MSVFQELIEGEQQEIVSEIVSLEDCVILPTTSLNFIQNDISISKNVISNDTESNETLADEMVVNLFASNDDNNEISRNQHSETVETFQGLGNNEESANEVFFSCTNCKKDFEAKEFGSHACPFLNDPIVINSDEIIKQMATKCLNLIQENFEKWNSYSNEISKSNTKKSNGPFLCKICDRKFVHASGLARHTEKHDMDSIKNPYSNTNQAMFATDKTLDCVYGLECFICCQIFPNADEILTHIEEQHSNFLENKENTEAQNVIDENAMLTEVLEIILHGNNDTKIKQMKNINAVTNGVLVASTVQCEFCNNSYSNVTELLEHSSKHIPSEGFKCQLCNFNAKCYKELIQHFQTDCKRRFTESQKQLNVKHYFVCNTCDNKFDTQEQLFEHRHTKFHAFPRYNEDNSALQVLCEYCGEIFDCFLSLANHYDDKHTKKPPAKKEKPNTTSTTTNNSSAAKSNNGSSTSTRYRQYLCDVCGKTYTQSSHLWQHLRFHKGVKPFACKEPGCDRRFTIRPDLNDHIRKCHTGERPYHCTVCDKRFLTGSVFYQHRLIHKGERRYGCNECDKRFYRADALKNHQRIHSGEKPYACDYCSKCFRQRGDRDKHTRARHMMQYTLKNQSNQMLYVNQNPSFTPYGVIVNNSSLENSENTLPRI